MTVYNKASLVLAESPAYKAGTIQPYYPLTPDVSFDFTRATSATRVNASGNIEKETQNLLLQSNQFDTTWTLTSASVTSGQSGYDGSNDAWLLEKSATGGFIRQFISTSGVQTFSVYLKANTLDWAAFLIGGGPVAYFNISNGTLGSGGSAIDHNIEQVGTSDWYRCSVSFNASVSNVRIYPADGDGDISGTSGSIYIQDAQLEQGLVARNYQETTTTAFYGGITDNIPRLDYTDSSCPALLLEPQRTNLILNSEGADKITSSTTSYTFNEIVSPDGYRNSIKIETLTAGSYRSISWGISLSAGAHTFSCYLKAGTSPYIGLFHIGTGLGWIDTSDFTKSSGSLNFDIENFGNGWYKIHYTITATAGNNAFYIFNANGNSQTNSDVGDNFYGYGFQVEEGSYATSYIPTYGTSVTRNGEVFEKTGLSSVIGQTEGTIFFEFEYFHQQINSPFFRILEDASNLYEIIALSSFKLRSRARIGGSIVAAIDTSSVVSEGTHKAAIIYKSGDYKFYLDGSLVGSSTENSIVSNPSEINYFDNNNNLKQFLIFPTTLTDDECIALTTL